MKTIEHSKKIQVVNYIRRLFRFRPEMFKGMPWDCVLREEKLIVVSSCSRKTDDKKIMRSFLESRQIPSMLSTYLAVRKHWDLLFRADIKTPITPAESTATSNHFATHKREQIITGKKAGKFLITKYIHSLFKLRPKLSHSKTWACVMRGRKLAVVKNADIGLTDNVIMHRFLSPVQTPPWFAVYLVVRRKWNKLAKAEIEIS